jgi:hypothetical protein
MFSEPRPIAFSNWVVWDKRKELEKDEWRRSLGVYLWAHFHEPPDAKVHPYPELPRELVYVGETKDLNMRPLQGNAHQRLVHYGDTFPRDRQSRRFLYVSVYHVQEYREDDERSKTLRAFTRYVEDKILWEYVQRYGKRAALDYKKKGDWDVVAECCAGTTGRHSKR